MNGSPNSVSRAGSRRGDDSHHSQNCRTTRQSGAIVVQYPDRLKPLRKTGAVDLACVETLLDAGPEEQLLETKHVCVKDPRCPCPCIHS